MSRTMTLILTLLCACGALHAEDTKSFDAAVAFGARRSVSELRFSPDGTSVAYIVPTRGQGSAVVVLSLAKGAVPKPAMGTDGLPFRLRHCDWVSNKRLVCVLDGVLYEPPPVGLAAATRVVAVNSDGTNQRLLSALRGEYSRGDNFRGGEIIDWLPNADGAVLMTRVHLPGDHLGTRLASTSSGLGVDWVDTRTLDVREVETARPDAVRYLSDGRGTVRILALKVQGAKEMDTGLITFLYRLPGSREWRKLSDYNSLDGGGFDPVRVDHDLNVAYGYKKKDGRLAVYRVTLDESLKEELVYAQPEVDIDSLLRIGHHDHVVGVSYVTDVRHKTYFDPEIESLVQSLTKALPQQALLDLADSTSDGSRMLIAAGSDSDPGVYYIFDRKSSHLETFLVVRNQLEGVKLASVKSVSYPASDGVSIPAYLTLPPGRESAKGLPAIVMPHGGSAARDQWGFNWLAQFYASRGFAVLQPNFPRITRLR